MEAALRTVAEIVNKSPSRSLNLARSAAPGHQEASYDIGGKTVNVAVASGLANARKLLDMIKSGEKDYHFVEIMACPAAVSTAAEPTQPDSVRYSIDLREVRGKACTRPTNTAGAQIPRKPLHQGDIQDFFGSPEATSPTSICTPLTRPGKIKAQNPDAQASSFLHLNRVFSAPVQVAAGGVARHDNGKVLDHQALDRFAAQSSKATTSHLRTQRA